MLLSEGVGIYFALEPADIRKNIDTLAILINNERFNLNSANGNIFVFLSKRRDRGTI